MSTIEIRNVPDEVHRKAKAQAALQGITLSELALRALRREIDPPTMAEIAARVHSMEAIELEPSAAAVIRGARQSRGAPPPLRHVHPEARERPPRRHLDT